MQTVRIKPHPTSVNLFTPERVQTDARSEFHSCRTREHPTDTKTNTDTQRADASLDFVFRDSSHLPVSSVHTAAPIPVTNDHARPRTARVIVTPHRAYNPLRCIAQEHISKSAKPLSIGMHTLLSCGSGRHRMVPLFAGASFQTAL